MKISTTIKILCLSILCVLITSCEKEEECLTGIVRFTNTSTNPYDLYIDEEFRLRLSDNSFQELDLPEGQHDARVEQVSGFILFPTVLENTLNVFGCQESEWVIP